MTARGKIFFLSFCLAIVGLYFLFVELYVPDLRPEPPPGEEVFDIGLTSTEDFVAFGERIFSGKGSCRLCHKSIGGRAPSLDGLAFTSEDRIKETAYKGRALSAKDYILESMLEPDAYVVSGYGKVKKGRMVSPMPVVTRSPVNLTALELRAVVAYLQDDSGVAVNIKPSLKMPIYGAEAQE